MPKTRTSTEIKENVTDQTPARAARHIRTTKSDAPDLGLAARIKELIGDDSQTEFAARCGFSEGMLRKYLKGARPGRDNLVAMASYRNVSLTWLATGKGDKYDIGDTLATSVRQLLMHGSGAGKTNTGAAMIQQLQDVAARYTLGDAAECPITPIHPELLRSCLLACYQVYGDQFQKAMFPVQLEYASDFYNQLVAMSNARTPRRGLDDFTGLNIGGLADQLKLLQTIGWVMEFPRNSDRLSGSW